MKRFDLLAFRRDKMLTQKDLAAYLKCKQAFISTVEHRRRPFPADRIPELEAKYGDLSDYITIPDEEFKENNAPKKENELNTEDGVTSAYLSVPSRLLDEFSKLTETIYSQQRTIEKLVNLKTQEQR